MRRERSFGLWAACFEAVPSGEQIDRAELRASWKAPFGFSMHRDHELLTGETPPPRCCRHLAGSAFLRLVFRQDAGSTVGSSSARGCGDKSPMRRREWVCAPTSTKTEQASHSVN